MTKQGGLHSGPSLIVLAVFLMGLVLWSTSAAATPAAPEGTSLFLPFVAYEPTPTPTPVPIAITTVRASVSSTGAEGRNDSWADAISANGRYVLFTSDSGSLVPDDSNGKRDVFVRDLQTGQTELVSRSSQGVQGNSDSNGNAISADGRFVQFHSIATNLVVGQSSTKGTPDVFVRDRQTKQTYLVSVNSDGEQSNSDSMGGGISADGRYVVFDAYASNLVPGDTNASFDVFVHDRQTHQTKQVSVSSSGAHGDAWSVAGRISADGRYVFFCSEATNLVSGDINGVRDAFIHDMQTGETIRVSVGPDGVESDGYSTSTGISADGQLVAFYSTATNLVPGGSRDGSVYVRDWRAGLTTMVSQSGYDPSISGSGRYVAYWSRGDSVEGNYVPSQIYVFDRYTGQTFRASASSSGAEGNWDSEGASVSSDGHRIAFTSRASNLVTGDTNSAKDAFVATW